MDHANNGQWAGCVAIPPAAGFFSFFFPPSFPQSVVFIRGGVLFTCVVVCCCIVVVVVVSVGCYCSLPPLCPCSTIHEGCGSERMLFAWTGRNCDMHAAAFLCPFVTPHFCSFLFFVFRTHCCPFSLSHPPLVDSFVSVIDTRSAVWLSGWLAGARGEGGRRNGRGALQPRVVSGTCSAQGVRGRK